MFSLREIIDMAVQIEKNGENYYREALRETTDPSLGSLFVFLADQEQEHTRWFEGLKRQVQESAEPGELAEIDGTMLQRLVGNQTFSLNDVAVSELDGVKRLLEVAIELEKDTIVFYQMLQAFIDDPDTLAELNEIIAEENRHVEMLSEYQSP
jgi:rubrerythrin